MRQVEASTLQTLVENKGLIQADGGVAILTARGASEAMKGVVNNSGRIEAKTLANKNGRILLLADMQHGEVNAAGELTAHFVETSAAKVNLDQNLKVDTQGGEWLIDPVDIVIDAAKASAIQTALASGNVTVSTADGAENPWGKNGTGSDPGDIHINADITWNSNTLTLNANRDININAVLTADGTSRLVMNTGGSGAVKVGFAPGRRTALPAAWISPAVPAPASSPSMARTTGSSTASLIWMTSAAIFQGTMRWERTSTPVTQKIGTAARVLHLLAIPATCFTECWTVWGT